MSDAAEVRLSDRFFSLLRILRLAVLVLGLFYVGLAEVVWTGLRRDSGHMFLVLLAVAAAESAAVLYIRLSLIPKVEDGLRLDSEDKFALANLRKWYVICYALCLGVSLYGLVLRILGAPFSKAAVFYVAGTVLILVCTPRKPM